MSQVPTAQPVVASRSDRYQRRRLSIKVLAFTPLTTVQDLRRALSPTAALRAAIAHHQTLTLRVRPLRNRNHPTVAAVVRTAVQNPAMVDLVTPMALAATPTRQYGQNARCHSTSKPSFSQRRWRKNWFD
jgi:hypothetical protein